MRIDQRMILAIAAAAIVGVAVGALWQYVMGRGPARELEVARHDLTFVRLEAALGAATIEAQRGNYEIARQLASRFFDGLQQDIGGATAARQPAFREILQQRDPMITALSRSDPQTGSLLAQLFTRYRIAMGEPVGADPMSSPPLTPPEAPAAADSPAGS